MKIPDNATRKNGFIDSKGLTIPLDVWWMDGNFLYYGITDLEIYKIFNPVMLRDEYGNTIFHIPPRGGTPVVIDN